MFNACPGTRRGSATLPTRRLRPAPGESGRRCRRTLHRCLHNGRGSLLESAQPSWPPPRCPYVRWFARSDRESWLLLRRVDSPRRDVARIGRRSGDRPRPARLARDAEPTRSPRNRSRPEALTTSVNSAPQFETPRPSWRHQHRTGGSLLGGKAPPRHSSISSRILADQVPALRRSIRR